MTAIETLKTVLNSRDDDTVAVGNLGIKSDVKAHGMAIALMIEKRTSVGIPEGEVKAISESRA